MITLLGAENGKIRGISEPLEVVKMGQGIDGEVVRARFHFVPPRMAMLCKTIAAWYLRQMMPSPSEADIEAQTQALMLSYSLRKDDGHYKEQVFPFPAVLASDGVTFKPDKDLFILIRDCDFHLYCAQAETLWIDYLTFKHTQFPDVVTKEALSSLLEDAKKKSLLTLLSEHGYWKIARLARGLVEALAESARGSGGAG